VTISGADRGTPSSPLSNRRQSDLQNERLPEFNTDIAPAMFAQSMRRGSGEGEGMTMEYLIKKSLEEEDDEEGGVVERISERLSKGRMLMSRPAPLKRHGTA